MNGTGQYIIREERGLMATLPVSRECMKLWDADLKTLWEAARKNLEEEVFQIETIGTVIENILTEMEGSEAVGMFRNEMEEVEEMDPNTLCITFPSYSFNHSYSF